MTNCSAKNKYGLKTWPILFSLLTVVILVFSLHYFQLSDDGIDLVCTGNSYGEDTSEDLDLKLSLETKSKQFSLNYQFYRKDKPLGTIIFSGVLESLDVASMTYKFVIDAGEFQLSFGQKAIPSHMSSIIDSAKRALEHSKTANLNLQIIEMNSAEGYAVIQFDPGNGIWICDLQ